MPSQTASTPMPAAVTIARTGPLTSRSAVAAGPTSSAVLSTAPMITAESATDTASAIRKSAPTARTGTPRASAMSGLSELSSSTRASTTTVASASSAEVISAGTVDEVSTKIDPNRIVNDAPVVELYWVPR